MNFEELQALNRATERFIAARRGGDRSKAAAPLPYYGYVNVDGFDCPPFIMFTNNDSPVVQNILDTGTFETTSVAVWCAFARQATGILDIGANVGFYSLCAAKLRPELSVHAFEPNPYAYTRLRIHKFVNDLNTLIERPMALGDRRGLIPISWVVKPGGNIASGAGLGPRLAMRTETAQVPITTLDGSGLPPKLGARPLVKIDVEGAEELVFQGAKELVARKPDIILETFTQRACDAINRQLLPLGYSVFGIREDESRLIRRDRLVPANSFDPNGLNQFLTTRTPAELANILPQKISISSAE